MPPSPCRNRRADGWRIDGRIGTAKRGESHRNQATDRGAERAAKETGIIARIGGSFAPAIGNASAGQNSPRPAQIGPAPAMESAARVRNSFRSR